MKWLRGSCTRRERETPSARETVKAEIMTAKKVVEAAVKKRIAQ